MIDNINLPQRISRLISALIVITLCSVITSAFVFQFVTGEKPCPLCFLQRIGMIGVAMGQVLNFRYGIKMTHHALSLFHCILGGSVSLRQISLHVCPDFPTYGTPVLGLELYTWALIIFACSIFTIAVLMWLYNPHWEFTECKWLRGLEWFAAVYLLCILAGNIISSTIICGFGTCTNNP